MATHSYLIEQENVIKAAREAAGAICKAYVAERVAGDAPHCYPANHDMYGTIHANLFALREQLSALLRIMGDEYDSV